MTKVKKEIELTPYEIWQLEKKGNIVPTHKSFRDDDDWDDTWQDDTLDLIEEFSDNDEKEVA